VAVSFGTPVSVRGWLATQPSGLLKLPRADRLPQIQKLADYAMDRIAAVIPVTPVPLACAALLSFGTSVVPRDRLLERMDELRDHLAEFNAKLVRPELPIADIWDRAWRMFTLRRLVVREGDQLVILPAQRPLLEYYANSIRHLLPGTMTVPFTPAGEHDATLPRLATREEMEIRTGEYRASAKKVRP
jgi:glycerol-3-phosphate O-acyltransferase